MSTEPIKRLYKIYKQMNNKIMIIAGEASGDSHGSKVVSALKKRNPSLSFFCLGGSSLKKAGVEIAADSSVISVMGIIEVFSKIPVIFKTLGTAKKLLKNNSPALLILIDFPDFNLKVAKFAKKLKIPVLYYVSPQIWAWRKNRIKKIAKLTDHVALILPFEEKIYKKHNIPASFVGHPLLDDFNPVKNQEFGNHVKTIGILPGSRETEINALLPVLLQSVRLLKEKNSDFKFILSAAPNIGTKKIEKTAALHGGTENIDLISEDIEDVFRQSDFLIAASGTVTLQAAVCGIPMIIVYKVSGLSYRLGKILIKLNNISLVNLIAEKEIVPELIQDQACADNIVNTALSIIDNMAKLDKMRNELLNAEKLLGGSGASERVGNLAENIMREK